ncbi:MAG: hypothetical protein AVDCRST_MAG33-347, partial [uncultured Thermomicrobiales bacterium]
NGHRRYDVPAEHRCRWLGHGDLDDLGAGRADGRRRGRGCGRRAAPPRQL